MFSNKGPLDGSDSGKRGNRSDSDAGDSMAIRVKAHFAVYSARHAKRPAVEAFLSWLHGEAAAVAAAPAAAAGLARRKTPRRSGAA